ncbi:ABC transporter permease [Brevundimonas sp.]|uniref:ABC transporter permease n=1 Tax=Brevundimonas sp. TaxID=1871086 RepID=UPI001A24EDA5|nr:ABC transporter permease [Brevundimonas sp.]MBJ7483589.1 ABC transporter permease [Brevundimonas sp.]
MAFISAIKKHGRLTGALMIREITTRFGREWGGFLWVIGEPLMFCVGVIILWDYIKPEYEHGIRVSGFVMTGYSCLTLIRHMIGANMTAIQANIGLLHHRQITILHVVFTRSLSEMTASTAAFGVVYIALLALGQVQLPYDWLLFWSGWFLMGWVALGLSLFMASLAIRFEFMERIVPIISYAMIPASGCFQMAAWIPARFRDAYLLIPLPHGVEMVRGAVFGEFVHVYYHPAYAFAWGAGLLMTALVLLTDAKDRVHIE